MSKFIVIASGKGGVGKTTTAINLATAMNALNEDVTLVDANLTTPNVGLCLGAPVVPVTLNHVLSGKVDLIDSIYEHESGTKIIPASLSIKELKRLNDDNLINAVKDLRQISDIVIFDCAAGLGSEAISTISIADDVIIVTNPEMPAITDALKTAKIAEEMGKNIKGIIVTKTDGRRSEMSLESISEMLELPILGVVPIDDKIQEALYMKNAVLLTHPKSKAAKSYMKIAAKILGKELPKKTGFFSRLFGFR